MVTSGIYQIHNKINGRCYYGSAIDLERREYDHRKELRGNRHGNRFLQRSWNKHGEDAFTFSVLEIVENKEDLISREQVYLDQAFSPDEIHPYNICRVAGSQLGTKRTVECRAKMAALKLGKPRDPAGVAKQAAKMRGRKKSLESIAKRTLARMGFRHTEQTKAKIVAAKTGIKQTPEHIEKRTMHIRGKPVSQSHRDALRDANRSLTVEQVAAIVSRRKAGESYKSIAKDFNTHKDTIRNWCLKEGLGQVNPYVTPEQVADIKNRRAAGQTYEQIAQGTGICEVTIWRKLTGKDQSKSSKAAKAALAVQPADDRTLFDDLGTD